MVNCPPAPLEVADPDGEHNLTRPHCIDMSHTKFCSNRTRSLGEDVFVKC